jgi:hypothetical protein
MTLFRCGVGEQFAAVLSVRRIDIVRVEVLNNDYDKQRSNLDDIAEIKEHRRL